MKIRRFNENTENIPTKQDIESIFSSAFDNTDEHSVVPVHIQVKGWYTGSTDQQNVIWSVYPLSTFDDPDDQQNGFIVNLCHNFYNPSSNVYNSKPLVDDFYRYAEMVADTRTALLSFKEEFPNSNIRFDMSNKSCLIIQILFT
jgi:hypothetical protein